MRAFYNQLPASFRGIPFWVDTSEIQGGRKQVAFEFPNKTARYIEDLGGMLKTYTIHGKIFGDDYNNARQALITALETKGPGILMHPIDGAVNVVAFPYTLTEDVNTNIGVSIFSMVFKQYSPNIYPSTSDNNAAYILTLFLATLESTLIAIEDLYNLPGGYRGAYGDANNTLGNIGTLFGGVTPPFDSDPTNLSEFSSEISDFNQNIPENSQTGSGVANSINNLFNSANNLGEDNLSKYSLFSTMFGYQDSTPLIPFPTAQGVQTVQNRLALVSQVNLVSLAYGYFNASQIDYLDSNQVQEIQSELETQYQYFLATTNIDASYLTSLQELRIRVTKFFSSVLVNIPQLFIERVSPIPITALTYQYYGSLALDETILSLNNITNPNAVSGDILLLTGSDNAAG